MNTDQTTVGERHRETAQELALYLAPDWWNQEASPQAKQLFAEIVAKRHPEPPAGWEAKAEEEIKSNLNFALHHPGRIASIIQRAFRGEL